MRLSLHFQNKQFSTGKRELGAILLFKMDNSRRERVILRAHRLGRSPRVSSCTPEAPSRVLPCVACGRFYPQFCLHGLGRSSRVRVGAQEAPCSVQTLFLRCFGIHSHAFCMVLVNRVLVYVRRESGSRNMLERPLYSLQVIFPCSSASSDLPLICTCSSNDPHRILLW